MKISYHRTTTLPVYLEQLLSANQWGYKKVTVAVSAILLQVKCYFNRYHKLIWKESF